MLKKFANADLYRVKGKVCNTNYSFYNPVCWNIGLSSLPLLCAMLPTIEKLRAQDISLIDKTIKSTYNLNQSLQILTPYCSLGMSVILHILCHQSISPPLLPYARCSVIFPLSLSFAVPASLGGLSSGQEDNKDDEEDNEHEEDLDHEPPIGGD